MNNLNTSLLAKCSIREAILADVTILAHFRRSMWADMAVYENTPLPPQRLYETETAFATDLPMVLGESELAWVLELEKTSSPVA